MTGVIYEGRILGDDEGYEGSGGNRFLARDGAAATHPPPAGAAAAAAAAGGGGFRARARDLPKSVPVKSLLKRCVSEHNAQL